MGVVIFLLQALVIIALPFGISRFFRLNSFVPLVVVQIAIGILLGPSVFGRIAPETFGVIFNPTMLAPLVGISSFAVLLFGFITGIHFDPRSISGRGRGFTIVAASSVMIPTACGVIVGFWIAKTFPAEVGAGIDPLEFAVAIGICLGVTALPVLGAILREMDLMRQRIGQFALGLAAVSDIALWVYLGIMMTVFRGQSHGMQGFATLILLPAYLLLMVFAVRPLLNWLVAEKVVNGRIGENSMVVVCAVAIGSSALTEAMGLHYLIGAFVAGTIMPTNLREPILDRLQIVTAGILMPFFFILTGLRTTISFGSTAFTEIFIVASILAIVSKVGATTIASRLVGESWRVSLAVGSLMQTKGLMEVVILTVLLQTGIITPTVFSAFLTMALLCTALTMPMTRLALARGPQDESSTNASGKDHMERGEMELIGPIEPSPEGLVVPSIAVQG